MDYWRTVRKTTAYIEDHLKDDITLRELAQHAGYSEYHFCRLFKSETGWPVMDYVRRRRLVHALADMNDHRDMAGIAMEYGFKTQGGFIKAFQRLYGDSPGGFRTRVLGKLPRDIQIGCIEKGKEDDRMRLHGIEDEATFKKVMIIADKIFNVTAQSTGKYGYGFWQEQFKRTPELMIYAEDAERICGLAYGWVDQQAVTIAYVGVEEGYRGRGIGRALVAEMENRAKALGYHRLGLGATEGEEGFYEKCGYTGNLLIQSEVNSIDELRSLNPGYEEIGSQVYDGTVNQLYLNVPVIDRELQRKYEQEFPACNTIMVYGKMV